MTRESRSFKIQYLSLSSGLPGFMAYSPPAMVSNVGLRVGGLVPGVGNNFSLPSIKKVVSYS